jgi:FHS family L-fucose permease-like MFS transporter
MGPYAAVGLCVCLLAIIIYRTRFPEIERPLNRRPSPLPFLSVLRRRRLVGAAIAQFFYVGAQVGIWSFFIDFAKSQAPDLGERLIAFLLSGSLGLLMIGRFSGAAIQRYVEPRRVLAAYAVVNVFLCLIAAGSAGIPAVAALWLTSFFMSIMYPTIFTLGVKDLGEETESGASFLVMALIGGALIPPLMGLVSDAIGGIHHVMVLPAVCFGVILVYALFVADHKDADA